MKLNREQWQALVRLLVEKAAGGNQVKFAREHNVKQQVLNKYFNGITCPGAENAETFLRLAAEHNIDPEKIGIERKEIKPGYAAVLARRQNAEGTHTPPAGKLPPPPPAVKPDEIVTPRFDVPATLRLILDEQARQTRALGRIAAALDVGHEVTANIRLLRTEIDRLERRVEAQAKELDGLRMRRSA